MCPLAYCYLFLRQCIANCLLAIKLLTCHLTNIPYHLTLTANWIWEYPITLCSFSLYYKMSNLFLSDLEVSNVSFVLLLGNPPTTTGKLQIFGVIIFGGLFFLFFTLICHKEQTKNKHFFIPHQWLIQVISSIISEVYLQHDFKIIS